ncbi:uncharacterized protein METZ01_LOCUS53433 [marine metagenome]|uniref:GYD domain-containing protein n=1 Tax=marine metagenome TaxID=408172 RepID=A0A381SAR4_9ZZZZ|nr:GYD domain-containing protein [Chloroflexota bacterium]|tara:strand:- start:96 stop:473 length:378 start_codon:yes stop_codon:yes gene_type:complete
MVWQNAPDSNATNVLGIMSRYFVQASYTQQDVAGLVHSPEDRLGELKALTKSVGGKVITFDYWFGELDVAVILETPDDTTMASLSKVLGGSGAVTNMRTTVLIPVADGFAAAQKAKSITYGAPGQ